MVYISSLPSNSKKIEIAKTPQDCKSKTYEILLTIYGILTDKSVEQDLDLEFITSLVKSIKIMSNDKTINTLFNDNSRFKSFLYGIKTILTTSSAKASMGDFSRIENLDIEKILNTVREGIK